MTRLDEMTLHKVRRLADAGASSARIAARYALPVEQVDFVCGRVPPGEGETYGGLVPNTPTAERCDTGPVLPFSCVRRLPPVVPDD